MTRTILLNTTDCDTSRLKVTSVVLQDLALHESPTESHTAVIGRIRVLNLGYEKNVFARISFDNWATYRDYKASYLQSTEDKDNKCDIFAFGFIKGENSPVRVELALSCTQNGVQYWDNNDGSNYRAILNEEVSVKDESILSTNPPAAENEISVQESDYEQFQPHPLTPTRIRFYSTIRNAPEKEIVPVRAKDSRHVFAYNALAMGSLQDISEVHDDDTIEEAIEISRTTEECAVLTETEGAEEDPPAETHEDIQIPQVVEEHPVEPMRVQQRNNWEDEEDAIFERLEKGMDADVAEPQNNELAQLAENSQVDEATKVKDGDVDIKEKTAGGEDKPVSVPVQDEPVEDEVFQAQSGKDEQKMEEEKSTRNEMIENEKSPKKGKKKGLFNRLCCGKAEYD